MPHHNRSKPGGYALSPETCLKQDLPYHCSRCGAVNRAQTIGFIPDSPGQDQLQHDLLSDRAVCLRHQYCITIALVLLLRLWLISLTNHKH